MEEPKNYFGRTAGGKKSQRWCQDAAHSLIRDNQHNNHCLPGPQDYLWAGYRSAMRACCYMSLVRRGVLKEREKGHPLIDSTDFRSKCSPSTTVVNSIKMELSILLLYYWADVNVMWMESFMLWVISWSAPWTGPHQGPLAGCGHNQLTQYLSFPILFKVESPLPTCPFEYASYVFLRKSACACLRK